MTRAKSSIEEPPELELKDLPSHLEYAYLEENDKLPVIIAKGLKVLKSHKRAIAWKITDIKGLFPNIIDPQDQEKTTFTCPYGTFVYRRMPFGLCNAPGTFQRCMMAIFHDMIEKTSEVFMDDFSVFGDSFDSCLSNLENMLKQPMTHLLEKETLFVFPKDCIDAFQTLKKKLTEAPILVVPDWNLPFELMCDASDFAIEKEMLAVVYAFEKFWPYLVLSKSIVIDNTNRDKKGSENLRQDHLSRLENPHKDMLENKDINAHFPLETLIKSFDGVCMGKKLLILLELVMKDPLGGHHIKSQRSKSINVRVL
ncbi:reverse transcriptase domain-containing protein [Tanacetum coccineum]